MRRGPCLAALLLLLCGAPALPVLAQELAVGEKEVGFTLSLEGEGFSQAVNLFLLITALSLAPAFIMMMTSFTRIVIVLGFLGQALGTPQAPSSKIIAGLALFLTCFIMQPVWSEIYEDAMLPYSEETISQQEALARAQVPLKRFMIEQTREQSVLLFMDLGEVAPVEDLSELPFSVLVPAFMISELQTAFQMGFLIYLPFLVIDAVVAIFLMSMGMMMLPPMMISLPFKLLLFVMVDGWALVVRALVTSFG